MWRARDPQIEEWATNTAPDVGVLQKLLSNLDYQRAVLCKSGHIDQTHHI